MINNIIENPYAKYNDNNIHKEYYLILFNII